MLAWLRFNKKEALSSLDGLYSRCSGNPEVPRWLGRMFVSGSKPQQRRNTGRQQRAAVAVLGRPQPQHVAVETQGSRQVGHGQADGADVRS